MTKCKALIIKMPDKSVWRVHAGPIAEDRAQYYAAHDAEQLDDTADKQVHYDRVYKEEVEHGLTNPDELIDWVKNEMDWDDLDKYQILPSSVPNYSELFFEAEITPE